MHEPNFNSKTEKLISLITRNFSIDELEIACDSYSKEISQEVSFKQGLSKCVFDVISMCERVGIIDDPLFWKNLIDVKPSKMNQFLQIAEEYDLIKGNWST